MSILSPHLVVYTVGHSTRRLEELVSLLQAHDVELLADIRRYPVSRRHPHFSRDHLAPALERYGIDYLWLEGLGGRRSVRKVSPHTGWRVRGFAAYADHMETAEFERAAKRLLESAAHRTTAVMCAEALPERCHRRLLSDWLRVRDVEVVHLLGEGRTRRHQLTDFARVAETGRLIYHGSQPSLLEETDEKG